MLTRKYIFKLLGLLEMPFESGAQFAARTSVDHIKGFMPKKHVHVDTDKQPTRSEQKEGQTYHKPPSEKENPPIQCPNCGTSVTDLASGLPLYTVDVKEDSGKSHKATLAPCPVRNFDCDIHAYSLEPCGCRVSSDWASAYAAEVNSRKHGGKPRIVIDMTEPVRDAKLERLERILAQLYILQRTPYPGTAKEREDRKKIIDSWIVVAVDQMQRLVPGGHNRKIPKGNMPLHPEVSDWASSNNYSQPSVTALVSEGATSIESKMAAYETQKITVGTAVWLDRDGKFTVQPHDPASTPYGIVTAIDGERVTARREDFTTSSYGDKYPMPRGLGGVPFTPINAKEEERNLDTIIEMALRRPRPTQSQRPPVLRTLPVEEVNVVGGTEEETAIYRQYRAEPLRDLIINGHWVSRQDFLQSVLALFDTVNGRGIILSILNQDIMRGATPEELTGYAASVHQEIVQHRAKNSPLGRTTVILLNAIDRSGVLTPQTVTGPKVEPAPDAPPEPSIRHHKKRRTIRKLGNS